MEPCPWAPSTEESSGPSIEQLHARIEQLASAWVSVDLHRPWLDVQPDSREAQRQSSDQLAQHVDFMLNTDLYGDPSSATSVPKNALKVFRATLLNNRQTSFYVDEALGSTLRSTEQHGLAHFLSAVQRSVQDRLKQEKNKDRQMNPGESDSGFHREMCNIWANLLGTDLVRQQFYIPEQQLLVKLCLGFTGMVEECLIAAQKDLADPRCQQMLHSMCPLIGDMLIGLCPLERKEGKILACLRKRHFLKVLGFLKTPLEIHLQKMLAPSGSQGPNGYEHIEAWVWVLDEYRFEVKFMDPTVQGSPVVFKVSVYFTYVDVWDDVRITPVDQLSEWYNKQIVPSFQYLLLVYKEIFILTSIAWEPTLRFGVQMALRIWRTHQVLQNICTPWQMVVLIWALHRSAEFRDIGAVIVRLVSAWSAGVFGTATQFEQQYMYTALWNRPVVVNGQDTLARFINSAFVDPLWFDTDAPLFSMNCVDESVVVKLLLNVAAKLTQRVLGCTVSPWTTAQYRHLREQIQIRFGENARNAHIQPPSSYSQPATDAARLATPQIIEKSRTEELCERIAQKDAEIALQQQKLGWFSSAFEEVSQDAPDTRDIKMEIKSEPTFLEEAEPGSLLSEIARLPLLPPPPEPVLLLPRPVQRPAVDDLTSDISASETESIGRAASLSAVFSPCGVLKDYEEVVEGFVRDAERSTSSREDGEVEKSINEQREERRRHAQKLPAKRGKGMPPRGQRPSRYQKEQTKYDTEDEGRKYESTKDWWISPHYRGRNPVWKPRNAAVAAHYGRGAGGAVSGDIDNRSTTSDKKQHRHHTKSAYFSEYPRSHRETEKPGRSTGHRREERRRSRSRSRSGDRTGSRSHDRTSLRHSKQEHSRRERDAEPHHYSGRRHTASCSKDS
ncbi:uncharacterized protein LOC129589077 [Paramacrobiotus metropolitanus]|uniref:uncharacterized protein LOC129589077 n=1 Tax=Paramacrobiotus metropolitanus TaxID=2943436 RepID=UPI0024457D0E|nr:uncharacterized protein LOC129589077 [Paramacrobiotus metropolitanus]XP_055339562.1 uncharacterized protein LOC129589077 [Paramacrobiotus metropolitanus]XP_055339564.1 uncharacterized protein LOC129589077 [Paramacrobiotus metropolitanus]XP_055339565.1 uncharacterized protein LOC129589077 [Paramacrobiotus metropolitanus]XP_055339566.1 uncharacterized protein LOC129589077 [Paramacrobiotus metropolitanus]